MLFQIGQHLTLGIGKCTLKRETGGTHVPATTKMRRHRSGIVGVDGAQADARIAIGVLFEKRGNLRLIASREASNGSVKINQDANLYVTLLKPGEEVKHEFASGRHGWLQVARGAVEVNGKTLGQGDGAAITDEATIDIKGVDDAEVLLFDLA